MYGIKGGDKIRKKENIIGRKFGKLTVIKECEKAHHCFIKCKCDCWKHKMSYTRLYSIYKHIKSRCHNKNNNKQNTIYLTHNGKTQTMSQWCNELNLKYITVYNRYIRGLSVGECLQR